MNVPVCKKCGIACLSRVPKQGFIILSSENSDQYQFHGIHYLYIADEVFGCGTATEVVGVHMIDHSGIGDGRVGSITR